MAKVAKVLNVIQWIIFGLGMLFNLLVLLIGVTGQPEFLVLFIFFSVSSFLISPIPKLLLLKKANGEHPALSVVMIIPQFFLSFIVWVIGFMVYPSDSTSKEIQDIAIVESETSLPERGLAVMEEETETPETSLLSETEENYDTTEPTEAITEPSTPPPTEPITDPPTEPTTVAPTEPPTLPPTEPPTLPPTDPPTEPVRQQVEPTVSNERQYVLNTHTMKFHTTGCSEVSKIKDENKQYYTGTAADLKGKGYSACKKCHPY